MGTLPIRAPIGNVSLGGWNHHRRQTLFSLALLLPASAVVLLMIVYPLYRVLDISLRDGKIMNFARIGSLPLGFENYRRVLENDQFWHSTAISAVYVSGSVGVAFLLGLATALLLNKNLPGSRALRTLVLLPWAVPGVIVSIVFLWVMDGSFGVLNAMLRSLGLMSGSHAWFVDSRTALVSVMVPTVWKAYPLITLTLLAALQAVPVELYEAARVDGATRRQQFRYVTWPGILGPAYLVVLISALGVFRDVDIIFATTGGGPSNATETLSLYVYREAFHYFRMGNAAAIGAIMIATAALASVLLGGVARRKAY